MVSEKRYEDIMRTDYLPDSGLVYVDASLDSFNEKGLSVEEISGIRVGKLTNWNNLFKERSCVTSVSKVMDEIRANVRHYRSLLNYPKKNRRNKKWHKGRSCGSDISLTLVDYRNIERERRFFRSAKKEYSSLCSILEQGMEEYLPREISFDYESVRRFIESEGLSVPDRSLIIAALSSGDGTGILSGDKALISVYMAAVNTLKLNDCFVSNVIGSRTTFIR